MRKTWNEWAGTVYICTLSAEIFLFAPLLPEGGYTAVTEWKFGLYAGLTGVFMLFSLLMGERRKRGFGLWELILLGWLLCSLLSALHSPWRKTAFFGGERREGFVTLLCYGFSALWSVRQKIHGKPVFWSFLIGVLWLDGVCILQLNGHNPLHLYPEGLSWADANVRYSGAYRGTVGNAGLTGTVLACACCLLFLLHVRNGGRFRLLLMPLSVTGWVLGQSRVDGPVLGLCCALALGFPVFANGQKAFGRYLCGVAVLLYSLLQGRYGILLSAVLLLGFGLEAGKNRDMGRWPLTVLLLGITAAVLAVYGYTGENTTLREAAALLRGECSDGFGNGRVYIWRLIGQRLPEHLWLGTGPDTLAGWDLPPYEWYAEAADLQISSYIDAAHNEYLQTLACQGLPAALCQLGLPLTAFFRLRKGGQRAVFGCCALCYAISGLTGISACAAAPLFYVMLALGEREDWEEAYDPDK